MTRNDRIGRAIYCWLNRHGHFAEHNGMVIAGIAELLLAHGFQLDRVSLHLRVLHPLTRSVWRVWRRDQPMQEYRAVHGAEMTSAYLRSAVKVVWETGQWIDRRIGAEYCLAPDDFTILPDLTAEGFSHYLIGPILFSDRKVQAISFATKTPGGFTDEDVALLHEIAEMVGPVIEAKGRRRITATLMETYLGHDTFEALMDGQVRLGDGRPRRAALWYSDMRGFTPLTAGQPLTEVVGVLNAYFGLVGAAATRHRGEIVQFIGDAILIYFTVDDADGLAEETGDAGACRRALAAAVEAQEELALWNKGRTATGKTPIAFGVGLDLGDVIHVNVGAAGRQSFNLVGPAVNRAARIEEQTKSLGYPILLSGDVARAIGGEHPLLISPTLRGVPQPVDIFAPSPSLAAAYRSAWAAVAGG